MKAASECSATSRPYYERNDTGAGMEDHGYSPDRQQL
jgi:hypothetical protein